MAGEITNMVAQVSNVSIHAPARGATIAGTIAPKLISGGRGFNPRAREGRDGVGSKKRGWQRNWVSIHAPARGATFPCLHSGLQGMCFNPRAREGRDL